VSSSLEALKARLAAAKPVTPEPTKIEAPVVLSPPISAPAAPNINTIDLQSKVAELQARLLDKHPMMPKLLEEIWVTVRKYPEQVLLLGESEIATIVNGLKVQTGIEFNTMVAKSPSVTKNLKDKIKTGGADLF